MQMPTAALTHTSPTNLLSSVIEIRAVQNGGESELERWSSFIGIVTAIVGNLLISFALNIQRYAHILIDREYNNAKPPYANGGHSSRNATTYVSDGQARMAEERRKKHLGSNDYKDDAEDEADDDTDGSVYDSPEQNSQSPLETQTAKDDPEDSSDDHGRPSYLTSPYWWVGLVLMIIGEAGNFLAYGFAPASIVSPLGVVALISNCMIAPLMLKERFRKRDFWGVLIAIAGAVTVVLSARTSEARLGPGELWKTIKRWEFLLYVIITLSFIVALMYAEPRYGRRTILIDLGLVGLYGGYTVLSTKGVASLLSASLFEAFEYGITYLLVLILVLSALMQIRYLNRALQNYDSTQVIPTQFVLFTISAIVGSAVLYRDFEHTTAEQAAKFVTGCFLTFFGVYLITSGREGYTGADAEDNDQDERIQLQDEEAESVDERTPLKRDGQQLASQRDELPATPAPYDGQDDLATPRRWSRASSSVPSVAVTPAEASDNLTSNPWLSSTQQVDGPLAPRTPRILRLQSESSTPFYTPYTSKQVLNRSTSSPADAETPSKQTTPRLPSPSRPAFPGPMDTYPTPTSHPRSTRGSISRLIPFPGPLLPPLSSSLSALVAESLLNGEGAPRSVRAAMRGHRSARHSTDERRRSVIVGDEENPLGLHFTNPSMERDLSRVGTHETAPLLRDIADEDEEPESGPSRPRTRLRALSETLSGMMGRGKGKKRDDLDQDRTVRPSHGA